MAKEARRVTGTSGLVTTAGLWREARTCCACEGRKWSPRRPWRERDPLDMRAAPPSLAWSLSESYRGSEYGFDAGRRSVGWRWPAALESVQLREARTDEQKAPARRGYA